MEEENQETQELVETVSEPEVVEAPKPKLKRPIPRPLEMVFRPGMEFSLNDEVMVVQKATGMQLILRRK